jgi:hypothetical protein
MLLYSATHSKVKVKEEGTNKATAPISTTAPLPAQHPTTPTAQSDSSSLYSSRLSKTIDPNPMPPDHNHPYQRPSVTPQALNPPLSSSSKPIPSGSNPPWSNSYNPITSKSCPPSESYTSSHPKHNPPCPPPISSHVPTTSTSSKSTAPNHSPPNLPVVSTSTTSTSSLHPQDPSTADPPRSTAPSANPSKGPSKPKYFLATFTVPK